MKKDFGKFWIPVMKNNFLEEAQKIAYRSTHRKHMTGCVIVNEDKIISNGWSHRGIWNRDKLYSTHAEIHALVRAQYKPSATMIYIVTVARKSGKTTNATPCFSCATALIAAGIDYAIYSTGEFTLLNGEILYLPDALRELKVYSKIDE